MSTEHLLGRESELSKGLGEMGFLETRQMFEGQFMFDAQSDRTPKLTQRASPIGLLFTCQNPNRSVQLGNDKFTISDHAYDGFEGFLARLVRYWEVVSAVLALTPEITIQKVGLRKVDSISVEPVPSLPAALSVFNPSLFGIARSGLVKMENFKGTEEVTVLEISGQFCVLRTKLEKRTENSLEANLDFDFVSLGATTFQKSVSEILPAINEAHFDLFMWAITDELLKLLEEDR